MADRVPPTKSFQFIALIFAVLLSPSAWTEIALDPGTGNCIDTGKNQSLPPSSPQCASLIQSAHQKKIANCYASGGQCSNSNCMQEPEILTACCSGAQSGGANLPGCPGMRIETNNKNIVPVKTQIPSSSFPTISSRSGSSSDTTSDGAVKPKDSSQSDTSKDTATDQTGKEQNQTDPPTSDQQGSSSTSQAAQDACYNAADDAASACGSLGEGGLPSGSEGGIASYSSTLYGAAGSAASANLQKAAYCTNRSRICQSKCDGVDSGAWSNCSSYAAQTQSLGQQAQQALTAQQGAYNSGNSAAAAPSSASTSSLAAKQIQGCDFNPNTPECQALNEANKPSTGDSGFQEQIKEDADFNISANTTGTQINSAYAGNDQGVDSIKPALPGRTIPNNSGGQIPGQNSQGPASLSGQKRPSPGSPGYSTDVLQGYQGGGGSQTPGSSFAGDKTPNQRSYARGQAQRTPSSTDGKGFDLKKYLPGGSAQRRQNLGGFIPYSTEINPSSVNIWSRISDRITEKCRLGELVDCQ